MSVSYIVYTTYVGICFQFELKREKKTWKVQTTASSSKRLLMVFKLELDL